jgi:hypothetical protein
MNLSKIVFILIVGLGFSNAYAKKTCDCVWLKDPTKYDFQPGTNLVVWNYNVKSWNEITIKDRMPECITACQQHLAANGNTVLSKICNNNTLYPTLPSDSTVKYRLGVKAVVNRPLLTSNIQTSGPYPYSSLVTKKTGSPCSY